MNSPTIIALLGFTGWAGHDGGNDKPLLKRRCIGHIIHVIRDSEVAIHKGVAGGQTLAPETSLGCTMQIALVKHLINILGINGFFIGMDRSS
jgi:hypothetical protein